MNELAIPSYLLPLEALESVEVIGNIREKTGSDEAQKRETWTGENRPGWVVPVEIIRGSRLKTLPNGKELETLETEPLNVTVWAHKKPDFDPGTYVKFVGLSVGAMGGKTYFQALGIEPKEEDFNLNFEGEK